jgi:hypothetical protein
MSERDTYDGGAEPVKLRRFAAPVLLTQPDEADDGPRWLQVAQEGAFLGHPTGPFELNATVFDELVRNFRRHPSYVAGADGFGTAPIVAYDFHHASEEPDKQTLAVLGAPAQAWALDLETRTGADGKAQLWALTQYLEPARTYVRGGKYRWCSIAVWPDTIDPVSGENIGWYLSSIAFTNDPFIQGMMPIAATVVRVVPREPRGAIDELRQTCARLAGLGWAE